LSNLERKGSDPFFSFFFFRGGVTKRMDLKSRLSRLQAQAGTAAAPAPAPATAASSLHQRLAQLRPERLHAQTPRRGHAAMPAEALAGKLGGKVVSPGLIRIRKQLSRVNQLGSVELCSLREHPRLPGESNGAAQRRVYLDTETTGLSGGSGTLAFLVGFAVVEADTITLTQFLLTRFAAEAALLAAIGEALSPQDSLVSYNGKSYDLPLLQTRFRMQGMTSPFEGLPHLDLLHPVRRLFGSRWPDCRLTSLERRLLGFSRSGDLPGSEAPAAWFSYVRGGRAEMLVRVVDHNRQDIVSLAVAHRVLTQAIEQPRAFGVDLHALARWLAESDEAAARTLLHAHQESLGPEGKRLLGRLSRRAGNWEQAVRIWESLAATGCSDSMERLAKYHEHISRDLVAARRCCARLPGGPAQQQRRERIERKLLGRNAEKGGIPLFTLPRKGE
jgi:uncharacterized protein YprB with RNaseH-like and TPR domain